MSETRLTIAVAGKGGPHFLPIVAAMHSKDIPLPTCDRCGQGLSEDDYVQRLGYEFAEYLYHHADGRFWQGLRQYVDNSPV